MVVLVVVFTTFVGFVHDNVIVEGGNSKGLWR
jgi:hypothetical protein